MSLSDFDMVGPGQIALDTGQNVSSPSSVRMGGSGSTGPILLSRLTALQVVRQGRIVWWYRYLTNAYTAASYIVFRAQAALGSASLNDSYYANLINNQMSWYYQSSGGVQTSPGFISTSALTQATWYHMRISWWETYNLLNQLATGFRFEIWNGSAWVQQGSDLYDTNRRNQASGVNRVGIARVSSSAAQYIWNDDTEFWKG